MKMYKGFDKDLKCRGFQYEKYKEYKESKAVLCDCGFHACENPIGVFEYSPPAYSRYCEVELDDVVPEKGRDSKRCGRRIRVGAEIGTKGIIEAFVKFTMDKIDWKNTEESNTGEHSAATNKGVWSVATNTGYYSIATNTGDQSAATNTGSRSVSTNTGDQSAATNTGSRSAATNTGNYSIATNTGGWSAAANTGDQSAAINIGYQSAATNTGDYSIATNTGDQSAATNTGSWSAATNTGDQSAAIVEGKESIAIATGIDGKAKGAMGCYIVLAEWVFDNNQEWHIKTVKAVKVDGENIKADTFYVLKDGEFIEAE